MCSSTHVHTCTVRYFLIALYAYLEKTDLFPNAENVFEDKSTAVKEISLSHQ